MYEGLKDFDLDEFWDDCMEKTYTQNNNKKGLRLKKSNSDYNLMIPIIFKK